MTTDADLHIPPQGTKPVYARLLRGYGPVALLALFLLLLATLVPTMDEQRPVDPEPTPTDGEVDR